MVQSKEISTSLYNPVLRLGRTLGASLQLDKRPIYKGKNVNPKLESYNEELLSVRQEKSLLAKDLLKSILLKSVFVP
jgi:hypothetical protein